MAEITRDVGELRDVEAALRRIDTGTYGMCVNCREPIAHERLEAYPTAKRCLPCQRRYDQSRGVAPPPSL
jgi:RNA polymerase-binding transcription factor DksA